MSEKALRKDATKEVKIIEWIINYMAESTRNIAPRSRFTDSWLASTRRVLLLDISLLSQWSPGLKDAPSNLSNARENMISTIFNLWAVIWVDDSSLCIPSDLSSLPFQPIDIYQLITAR